MSMNMNNMNMNNMNMNMNTNMDIANIIVMSQIDCMIKKEGIALHLPVPICEYDYDMLWDVVNTRITFLSRWN